jgi:5-methylcytosine-specific restriction endonuclease McrA
MSDPTIAYSFDNLELLCQACHNKEHFGQDRQKKRYKINSDGSLSY